MADTTGTVGQVAKIDDIICALETAVYTDKRRSVTVNILRLWGKKSPGLLNLVPAKSDHHPVERTAVAFAEFNFLAFLKIYGHTIFSFAKN